MPISKLLQSLNGTCRRCGQRDGFLHRNHPDRRQSHQASLTKIVQLTTNLVQLQP